MLCDTEFLKNILGFGEIYILTFLSQMSFTYLFTSPDKASTSLKSFNFILAISLLKSCHQTLALIDISSIMCLIFFINCVPNQKSNQISLLLIEIVPLSLPDSIIPQCSASLIEISHCREWKS